VVSPLKESHSESKLRRLSRGEERDDKSEQHWLARLVRSEAISNSTKESVDSVQPESKQSNVLLRVNLREQTLTSSTTLKKVFFKDTVYNMAIVE
jgi:hypothetical protein